jgi:anti-sigma factor RsiW
MTPHVESLLLQYQLGSIDDHERAEVERHLLSCEACLRSLLGLKRRLDLASASEDRPSIDMRFRVRATVAQKLPSRRPFQVRFVVAGAAAAGAFSLFVWFKHHSPPPANPAPPQELIDTGADPHPSVI